MKETGAIAQRLEHLDPIVANGVVADVDVVDEECGLVDDAGGWFLPG